MSAILAYLGSDIPGLSSTFIYREIFELERRGYRLQIYSLRRPDFQRLSAEALPLRDRTNYLLPVQLPELLFAHLFYVARHPIKYARTIWKMLTPFHHRLKDRVRSLMHFGEGVVLARQMEKGGVTHVHSHYASQPTSVARVVHLLTGIPYSFSGHAHDIWEDKILLREKLQEARFAVCCSGHGHQELTQQGNPEDSGNVHVVYHGIDVQRFAPSPDIQRSSNLILSVGRLVEMKGFHYLVTACRLLKERGNAFQCLILGEGPERARLEGLIAEYELEGQVKLPGAVTQEQILHHYHEAAIFVLPCIKTRTNGYDGIPNVLVEAMATGLPVVSTPISGIPELVESGENGFLVAANDSVDLASSMEKLLVDPALRKQFGENSRKKVVEGFDNQKTIEPLIALFQARGAL